MAAKNRATAASKRTRPGPTGQKAKAKGTRRPGGPTGQVPDFSQIDVLHGSTSPLIRAAFSKRLQGR